MKSKTWSIVEYGYGYDLSGGKKEVELETKENERVRADYRALHGR